MDGRRRARQYTDGSGNVVYDVTASPDVAAFDQTWAESGVAVSASSDALANQSIDGILDRLGNVSRGACTLGEEGRLPYSDALYTGSYEWWLDCGPTGAHYVLIAAEADDGSHLAWIRLQLLPGDEWVVDPIVGSFMATF